MRILRHEAVWCLVPVWVWGGCCDHGTVTQCDISPVLWPHCLHCPRVTHTDWHSALRSGTWPWQCDGSWPPWPGQARARDPGHWPLPHHCHGQLLTWSQASAARPRPPPHYKYYFNVKRKVEFSSHTIPWLTFVAIQYSYNTILLLLTKQRNKAKHLLKMSSLDYGRKHSPQRTD